MEQIEMAVSISHELNEETAGAIRTAHLMAFVQTSQKFPNTVLDADVARVAAQYLPQPDQPVVGSLEGLRAALLAPREIVRDKDGFLYHDALPIFDEGTNVAKLLEAFQLECAFSSMESDRPEYHERWAEEGIADCKEWEPSTPSGNGWVLLEIYCGEEDCYALYVRCKYEAERERREEQRASRRRCYEHNLQHALVNDLDV